MPRLFYHCYDHQLPRGGQKETYRHVDILNANGWDAYIYHATANYRLTWFPNDTRVIDLSEVEKLFDPAADFRVLPEDLGWRINKCRGRKVIFNKGLGLGFAALGQIVAEDYPYQSPDVVAAFVMSDDNQRDLQLGFPMLQVYRMYSEVDPRVFSFRPLTAKKPLIAVVSKTPSLALSVFHTINARARQNLNNGSGFDWVFLGKLPERELASCLQDAVLVLYASETEGGPPRTLLEAMSCGCLLAPFCIAPISEGIPPYATFAPGDMGTLVQFVENVMASYPAGLSQWQPLVDSGRGIASRFSPARQSEALVKAWTDIAASSTPIMKGAQ